MKKSISIIFEHKRGDLYCSNGRLIYINTPQFPFIYFFGFISFFGSKKMSNQQKNFTITRRHFKKCEFNHLVCLETLISIATPWACLFCFVCLAMLARSNNRSWLLRLYWTVCRFSILWNTAVSSTTARSFGLPLQSTYNSHEIISMYYLPRKYSENLKK